MDTPYQWTKQVAAHFGGTRTGTIIHWPAGFQARGQVRSQFHHIIDVEATILDVTGIPEPTFVNGIQQMPLHGVETRHAFDDANAPEARGYQYFLRRSATGHRPQRFLEHAVTHQSVPWDVGAKLPALDDDVWELYDTNTDWSQAHDISLITPTS